MRYKLPLFVTEGSSWQIWTNVTQQEAILASLDERNLLTEELRQAINSAPALATLEDIYLPYRPKRQTRAHIAKEKDLEPLAKTIYGQGNRQIEPDVFVNPDKEVKTVEEALSGARDIIAEWISEDASIRARLRSVFQRKALVISKMIKGQKENGGKFRDYFDWQEPVVELAGHRYFWQCSEVKMKKY